MSLVVALLLAGAPRSAWLDDAQLRLDFTVQAPDAGVPGGYALQVPLPQLDAGWSTLARWNGTEWLPLDVAEDTDPTRASLWFALPAELPPRAFDDDYAVFFGASVRRSTLSPQTVFLRWDDFSSCDYGTWVRGNMPMSMSLDPLVSHRPGGCSLKLSAERAGFVTLATPERYTSIMFDAWWLADTSQGSVYGNSVRLQPDHTNGFALGFVEGAQGWGYGRLVSLSYTSGTSLGLPPPTSSAWRRVRAGITDELVFGCVDDTCLVDPAFPNVSATYDGGTVGLGRRVLSAVTDGGRRLFADDVIVRPFQYPEPEVLHDGGLLLGALVECGPSDVCAFGDCEPSGLCPEPPMDGGIDAGSDGGSDAGDDAGTPDAGTTDPDGGTLDAGVVEEDDAGVTLEPRSYAVGCGCALGGDGAGALLWLALVARRRKLTSSARAPAAPLR